MCRRIVLAAVLAILAALSPAAAAPKDAIPQNGSAATPARAASALSALRAAKPEAKDAPGAGRLNPGYFESMKIPPIAYSEAAALMKAGKVSQILVRDGGSLTYFLRTRDGRLVKTAPPGNRMDQALLASSHAELWADSGDQISALGGMAAALANVAILAILCLWMLTAGRKMLGNPAQLAKRDRGDRVTFEDVAGQDEAKCELQEIVAFLKDPGKFAGLGARVPRGVLLEGDPGNGKTLLARAVAGEADVPFYFVAGSDFLEMFAGLGARRVRSMFRTGRRHAPCIIFIDEVDSMGGARGAGPRSDVQGDREQTLNQLLVALDGMVANRRTGLFAWLFRWLAGKRGQVVLMAATNRADILDPALLRPGRLDRRIFVSAPDLSGRERILRVHSRQVPLAADVDIRMLASLMPGASGADLANLVNEAAIQAGRWGLAAVNMACFQAARDRHLLGPERRGTVMSAEERRGIAGHEAGHALVAYATPLSDPINKVTIIPRGRAMGFLSQVPEADRHMLSRAKLLDILAVAMGGRAAEALLSGEAFVSTGAEADIEDATRYARMMVARWGMSPAIGRMTCVGKDGQPVVAAETMALVDAEVKALIDGAYRRASDILAGMLPALEALTDSLLEAETMTGAQIADLVDGKGGQRPAAA
jgi:cell division protease FtsH